MIDDELLQDRQTVHKFFQYTTGKMPKYIICSSTHTIISTCNSFGDAYSKATAFCAADQALIFTPARTLAHNSESLPAVGY